MPGNQSPSFIPKRTPQKAKKKRTTRRIYLLSYIAYIVFFGGLIATAGVYVYKLQVTSQLVAQQKALIEERQKFSQADMERVLELETRLDNAQNILDRHVSIATLFDALDSSVAETVQFEGLELKRSSTSIEIMAEVVTDAFDSTLFQRTVLNSSDLIASVAITELGLTNPENLSNEENEAIELVSQEQAEASRIGFALNLQVSPTEVEYDPFRSPSALFSSSTEATTDTTETGVENNVEENI